jgi:hypothetical protein
VLAIRINRGLRQMPDYKKDSPIKLYQAMETILDKLEYLAETLEAVAGNTSQSIIELETGAYLLCILPAH